MMKQLHEYIPPTILLRIRKWVMKRAVFTGTHADNAASLLKWRKDNPVVVLHTTSAPAKVPSPDSPLYDREMRKYERIGAKKARVLTVWYVEDNAFNRLIGFKKERIMEDMKLNLMN